MKNKAPLPLMEQLIMVLVFALTAALCLQGFALAERLSHRQEARERAVIMAQNAAETLKACSGDFKAARGLLGGTWDETSWEIPYDASGSLLTTPEDAAFLVQASPLDTGDALLGSAHIQVLREEETLFELTIAWQEVNKNANP